MRIIPPAAAVAAALLSCACSLLTGTRKVSFVHSSLDFNEGRPHAAAARLEASGPLASRLEALAGELDLRTVSRNCGDAECLLVFEGKIMELTKTVDWTVPSPTPKSRANTGAGGKKRYSEVDMATGAVDLLTAMMNPPKEVVRKETVIQRIQSRYFVRVRTEGGTTAVEAVGVPVQNGVMSCPPLLAERFLKCRTRTYAVYNNTTPAENMRHFWPEADISGLPEAEIIERLLLKLEKVR